MNCFFYCITDTSIHACFMKTQTQDQGKRRAEQNPSSHEALGVNRAKPKSLTQKESSFLNEPFKTKQESRAKPFTVTAYEAHRTKSWKAPMNSSRAEPKTSRILQKKKPQNQKPFLNPIIICRQNKWKKPVQKWKGFLRSKPKEKERGKPQVRKNQEQNTSDQNPKELRMRKTQNPF